MKQIFSLTFFMITILLLHTSLSTSTKATTNLKTQTEAKTSSQTRARQITVEDLKREWDLLFTTPRGNSCSMDLVKPDLKEVEPTDENANAKLSGWGFKRPSTKWIKRWGFGGAAYLIDFLDPIVLVDFTKETQKILDELKAVDGKDSDLYFDKLNIKFIAPKENQLNTDADFKSINPKFSKEIFDASINTCKLNKVIPTWGWATTLDAQDTAYDFVVKYDLNGDGRLNALELILGVIWNNKKRESLYCHNCYFFLAKRLGAIFNYFDCSSRGYITAEDLWNKLPNLKRKSSQWNIFANNTNDTIRTLSVNDFILKNGYTVDAGVTKNEFISGILLGLWQRNVSETGVLSENSRSLKDKRWSANGMEDSAAVEYINMNKAS